MPHRDLNRQELFRPNMTRVDGVDEAWDHFKSLDDFEPENVVNQVEPLRKLLEARRRLSDLVHKLDGNDLPNGRLIMANSAPADYRIANG